MKITHTKEKKEIPFRDLEVGEFYYDKEYTLCLKIQETLKYNTIIINEMLPAWEDKDNTIIPLNTELIIK